ncbi:hypothetical protein [Paenibacillus ihumii]|nr:hypothetical protein [Paenibacillus ihumii]
MPAFFIHVAAAGHGRMWSTDRRHAAKHRALGAARGTIETSRIHHAGG